MKLLKAYSDIDFVEKKQNSVNSEMLENVKTLQVGFGGKNLRIDSQGLWMGADKFSDAPFSVDMDGNMKATSVTLSGYLQVGDAMTDVINDGDFNQLSDLDSNLGSITAGSITGVTLTGNTIRTSASGSRVEITGAQDRIDWYNSSNFNTARFDDTGLVFFKGVEDPAVVMAVSGNDFSISASAKLELFGTGGIYAWDDLYNDGDIIPFINNSKYLGTTSSRFRTGYFYNIDLSSNLTVNGISTINGKLSMTSAGDFFNLPRMSGGTASGLSSTDGSMYYRTDDDKIRVRVAGVWISLN